MNIFKSLRKGKKEETVKKEEVKETPVVVPQEKPVTKGKLVHSFLKRPYLTEKARAMGAHNKYVFLVESSVNKPSVKEEISRRYGVKVIDINMVRRRGKTKQWRNVRGRQALLKKAIITLAKGQKIEIT